jgi:hypothetical protein
MTNFAKKVTTPDPDTINTLCHAARVSTMTSILGSPQLPLNDDDCQDKKASQKVKDLLETRNVGPFSAKGIKPFLDLLTRVFARVKSGNPDLYSAIKQDGVLCVRYIKDTSIVQIILGGQLLISPCLILILASMNWIGLEETGQFSSAALSCTSILKKRE